MKILYVALFTAAIATNFAHADSHVDATQGIEDQMHNHGSGGGAEIVLETWNGALTQCRDDFDSKLDAINKPKNAERKLHRALRSFLRCRIDADRAQRQVVIGWLQAPRGHVDCLCTDEQITLAGAERAEDWWSYQGTLPDLGIVSADTGPDDSSGWSCIWSLIALGLQDDANVENNQHCRFGTGTQASADICSALQSNVSHLGLDAEAGADAVQATLMARHRQGNADSGLDWAPGHGARGTEIIRGTSQRNAILGLVKSGLDAHAP